MLVGLLFAGTMNKGQVTKKLLQRIIEHEVGKSIVRNSYTN